MKSIIDDSISITVPVKTLDITFPITLEVSYGVYDISDPELRKYKSFSLFAPSGSVVDDLWDQIQQTIKTNEGIP